MSVIATPNGYTMRLDANASGFAFSGFQRIPEMAGPKYVIWTSGSLCQTMNSNTGRVEYSGINADSGIAHAFTNLTSGRAYRETVKLRGDFIFPQIFIPSFTILDLTESQVFQTSGTNANFISNLDQTNGNNNIEIIGGVVDGNKIGNSAGGSEDSQSMVYFKKCSRVWLHHGLYKNGDFHNIRFRDCTEDIRVTEISSLDPRHEHIADHAQGTTQGSCHDHIFANNYFENIISGQSYITTINVSDVVIANNTCHGMHGGTSSFAINGLRSVIVNNIIASGDGYGINLSQISGADYDSTGSIVANNTIKNIARYGIQCQGMPVSNIVISNNIVDTITEGTMRGIYVLGLSDSIISNNIVHDIIGAGIVARGSAAAGLVSDRLKINDNIVYNCGQGLDASAKNRAGIAVFGDNVGELTEAVVEGNKCYDIQSSGTQPYGMFVQETEDCVIKNNDLRGHTTVGFFNSGSSALTVFGNAGYRTENRGIFLGSGNASTTVYTFAHGLAVSAISGTTNITPASPQASSGPGFITSGGASNISVTYRVAPSSGDVRLQWSVAA
jgi:hypothetical protein